MCPCHSPLLHVQELSQAHALNMLHTEIRHYLFFDLHRDKFHGDDIVYKGRYPSYTEKTGYFTDSTTFKHSSNMQFSVVALLAAAGFSVANAAVDQSQVDFLTALVGDYNSHKREYLNYFQTAKDVPTALSHLAVQVRTYTDDSYTTLLADLSIDVPSLQSYATQLPWYSRVAAEVGGGSVASAPASETGSGSSAASSETGSAAISSNTGSASVTSGSSLSSTAASSTSAASTSKAGLPMSYAPLGAVLGALGVALL